MLVKDIMTAHVYTINQNQSLLELQGLMSDDNIRRVPVLNDAGTVVGIITDRDVKMASPSEASTLSCSELPLRDEITCSVCCHA